MAAYSAVACFRQTLEQLLDSDEIPLSFPKPQIQSLQENVRFLQSSLDKISSVPKKWRKDMSELQTRIRDAIYAAQDEVEYSISKSHSSETPYVISFKKTSEDVDLVAREAEETAEAIRRDQRAQNLFSENPPPFQSNSIQKVSHNIVGQEEDFKTVMDWLQSDDKARLVIPITGLAGIGKTTLARSIYESKQTRAQFHIRAWVTVSQEYTFQEIFSKLLNSIESKNYGMGHYASQGDEQTLLKRLHQELYSLKYLVVIDDVWDTEVWDTLKQAMPDKENGSRILLTTRIGTVANKVRKSGFFHELKPLEIEHSWVLLCYRVFGDKLEDYKDDITKACPPHLKDIGRSIAEKCKGLPLSLVVVGGLLSQERVQIDYWKRIEEDIADAAAKGEDSYLKILSLSYDYLPPNLKACFLYMGAFPEDSEIRVSKLIKLWVAEGFLTPSPQYPTLELVAQKSFEDLIGRNLIAIRKKSSSGGMKACGMHNSLRDLAEKESVQEKFFHSRKTYNQQLEENTKYQRRVSVHMNLLMSLEQVYESTKTITSARSLLYVGSHHHHPLPFCLTYDLLRVLDAFTVYFVEFPDEFLQLVHLRYLSLTYNDQLPPEISLLQKLQTLMVRRQPKLIFVGVSFLPNEIWKMPELRHLWFTETDFPALPSAPQNIALLLNLQTLANVDAAFFTDEIIENMPNLKKLAMWIEAPDMIGFSVDKLSKLEHFKFVVLKPIPGKGMEVEAERFFPKTLKRLTLSGTGLPWEYMKFVAEELKDLEVLKLKELAFQGHEWCLLGYQFKELKYLLIEYLNFGTWEARARNFPSLQRLILRHCYELEEIPQDIGYIGPLELIELVDCSTQAVSSAEEIIEEQENYDKKGFVGYIFSSWE